MFPFNQQKVKNFLLVDLQHPSKLLEVGTTLFTWRLTFGARSLKENFVFQDSPKRLVGG